MEEEKNALLEELNKKLEEGLKEIEETNKELNQETNANIDDFQTKLEKLKIKKEVIDNNSSQSDSEVNNVEFEKENQIVEDINVPIADLEVNNVEFEGNKLESEVNDIVVEKTEINDNNENKHKRKNRTLLFVLALLIIVGFSLISFYYIVGSDEFFKTFNIEKNKNKEIKEVEKITYEPYKTKSFSLKCYYKIDSEVYGDIEEKTSISNGDIIVCLPNYEVLANNPLNDLTFEINYGSGLKLISTKSDVGKIEVDGNTANVIFSKFNSAVDNIVRYEFEVIDNTKKDDLFVSLDSIKFRALDGKYYETKDPLTKYLITSKNKYIYVTEEGYVLVNDYPSVEKHPIERIYECKKECENFSSDSPNYLLFIDDGLVVYDIDNDKKENINYPYDSSYNYSLVIYDKPRGIIASGEEKIEYYSIEYDKLILSYDKTEYKRPFIYKSGRDYLVVSYFDKDESYIMNLLDFEGKVFKPKFNDLIKLENSNYYQFKIYADQISDDVIFYTNNIEPLFDGKSYSSDFDEFLINDGNLIINGNDRNKFLVYDSNYQLVKTSKEYKKIYNILEGPYFIVLDSDNYIKIINYEEEEKAKIVEMSSNLTYHSMISGWHTENNKNGIYMVFGNADIEYPKLGSGLEYFYIPDTNEMGVIEIEGVGGYAKPVLYLYPTKDTNISVSFKKPQLLTTTYPKFINNWKVLAKPNGDLYDSNNKYYYGLYWEEEGSTEVDFSKGFYVTKSDAINFLEDKLSVLGLNDRERNEFIMYWLPILEKNEKNLVYFELTEERDRFNKLIIDPMPDSLLRIAIHIKKVDKQIKIKEQVLPKFSRKGFAAIEWGGVIHN